MEVKAIELRDRATFIPAIAIRLDPANEEEFYLLARAGFGPSAPLMKKYVLFGKLDGSGLTYDPYQHGGSRTWEIAHRWVITQWDMIKTGDVVDVACIVGETKEFVKSERIDVPLEEMNQG
jgi:hypothetical protein